VLSRFGITDVYHSIFRTMHRRHASKKKQATADKHNTTYTPEVAVPHAEVADEIRRFQALLDQIHWSVLVTAGRIRVHIILSQHHFNPVSTTHMDRQTDRQTDRQLLTSAA